jgi:hypothetical protein
VGIPQYISINDVVDAICDSIGWRPDEFEY